MHGGDLGHTARSRIVRAHKDLSNPWPIDAIYLVEVS